MSTKKKAVGFGFMPAQSAHHFLVTIPVSKKESVFISEHFNWDESVERRKLTFALGNAEDKMRVVLPWPKWEAIAECTEAEFNRRLRRSSQSIGHWRSGQVPVACLLGKELVLLAWAIEDSDPALIPIAIKNWQGLAPEERWWLFTMTNAATGHAISGRNKGWRKAVRYALTENPVSGEGTYEFRPEIIQLMEEVSVYGHTKNAQVKSGEGEL